MISARGRFSGYGPALNTRPYDSIRAAIISGSVALYAAFEVLFRA